MPGRDFAQVQTDLERTVGMLKENTDAKQRHHLLLEMRMLLAEADRLAFQTPTKIKDQTASLD
jgi:hypothetical protein